MGVSHDSYMGNEFIRNGQYSNLGAFSAQIYVSTEPKYMTPSRPTVAKVVSETGTMS